MSEDIKAAILAQMEKNAAKGKKKTYINEVPKQVTDFKKRDVNIAVQDMIAEGILAYWSSGSTTYVMLKADFEADKDRIEGAGG